MNFEKLARNNIVEFLGDIFNRRGAEAYIGEPVTISQHMLQGALLAEQADAEDILIIAALLHDIGHFTNEFPDDAAELGIDSHHDEAGAKVLERFFPTIVTECVRQHVAAKRYLCAINESYLGRLSEASVLSLGLQGGPMSEQEVSELAKNPFIKEIIQVRIWDDEAKDPAIETPPFEYYAPMLQRVVDGHLAAL